MHQYQERDGEEDRKPCGKTRVKEIWKVWRQEGQSGRMIFNTIPATPDAGKKPEEKKKN